MASGTPQTPPLGDEMACHDGMKLPMFTTPEHVETVKDSHLDGAIAIVGYPKTGNTWLAEIAWLVCNDGNTEMACQVPRSHRVSFIDVQSKPAHDMEKIEDMQHLRLLISHLPCRYYEKQLQEQQVKIVIPFRNPKDTLVSLYHFYQMNAHLGKYTGTWNQFFDMFKANELVYGDYFDWYKAWWKHRDSPKMLFIRYEDMKKDMGKEIKRLSIFLEKDLSEKVVNAIVKHCSFKEMSQNKMVNGDMVPASVFDQSVSHFMRKGLVGDWKNYFNDEQSSYIDDRSKGLENQGITLPV